jgi:hypothetical protein
MKFVCDLLCLGGSFSGGSRILASPITADDLYFWVRKEPSGQCLLLAVWKQFDRATFLKINKDRPIGLALFPRSGKGNGVAAIPSPKNEVGYRRGAFPDPFPLPPSQTVQARFRAYSFPEEPGHSIGNKQGLTHCAALQP